jgi:hypothetical protein
MTSSLSMSPLSTSLILDPHSYLILIQAASSFPPYPGSLSTLPSFGFWNSVDLSGASAFLSLPTVSFWNKVAEKGKKRKSLFPGRYPLVRLEAS